MIKKIILVLIISFIMINLVKGNQIEKEIPEEAIRLRVVANSDSEYDQEIKLKVKNQIQKELKNLLKDAKDILETRQIIIQNYELLDEVVSKTLQNENYTLGYTINYGYNYFPKKEYNGIIYEEGEYESLLITLGEGKGKNWWCVLFPPLCLIEAEETEETIEYDSYILNLLKKIFDK